MYNLTNPQKSIWLTEQFYKNTPIENITGCVTVLEKLDLKALQKAINLFVEKNDSFRLKFILKDDNVFQYLSSFSEFEIENVLVKTNHDVKNLENQMSNTVFEVLDNLLFSFKTFTFPDGHGGYILTAHHLIYDAWTASLVGTEIINYYEKIINAESLNDISNPSYIDYIVSEQEYLKSEKFKKDKEFWNGIFNSIPEIATIPSINGNSQELSCKSKRKQFIIPEETISLINKFCKENKASIFNFFMAVFSLYISRVSSLNDFTIGTPILNRGNFKEKQTTGMFISNIPFRVCVNNDISFAQFLSNISMDFLKIFRHQKYPYQYLLEDLRKQDSSLPNLYNILISYQNARINAQTSSVKYESEWVETNYIADDMDIHIYDMNDTGNINIAYDYLTSKYSIDDICFIHARILHIINQILENNEINLKDIEIVTPDEKKKLLYTFNNTKMDYPKDKTISQLFEEQVEKTPDNIAVVFGDQQLTYRELNERANSLANYLRNNKISRNDIVGIMVNRSLEMLVAILAVLKSGASYIPIDPEYPQDRIEYMLNNSNAKMLLTFKKLESKVTFGNKLFIELDNKLYTSNRENLKNINKPEDLAYIIYTSGSTGLPKGVMLKHMSLSNLANYCNNYVSYLKNNSYISIASITTVSFDIFIFETLISLQRGLKVVIANENEQTIPRLLNSLIEKHDITAIQMTPSRMQLLINNLNDIPALSNLNFITLAGEQLPYSLVQSIKKISSNCTIYNGYGPSETTVFSTLTDVTNHPLITIGKPLDNTQIYILDNDMHISPIGIAGEIYISGDGVGLGYLNNKALTAKNYLQNKFSTQNSVLYKTGDFGYFSENGEIICLGRNDNQVKIRGLRIELGEIENEILKENNIKSCIVVKKVLESSHECLCAYYVAINSVDISKLKLYLRSKLPNYMVPQYFIKLDELPYTPNGKIDRKNLPMPSFQSRGKEIIRSRNSIDSALIRILQELLTVENISIDDSIFELGGDSLTAISLCAKIYSELNVQIFVKDILENPVIKDLSDLISSKANTLNKGVISSAPKSPYYIASAAQSRMYYASKISGDDSILYNISGGLILDKMPDEKKLQTAFNKLIEHQPSLRTYFELNNENVVQKICDKINFKLDISNDSIPESKIDQFFKKFNTPFNLSEAPLFRAKLIKLDDGKAFLMIAMHHIISDGTSLSILAQELSKFYNDETINKLSIDYKDYSVWENKAISSGELKDAEDYWLNQFNGDIPVLNMPITGERPLVQSFDGNKVNYILDKELTEKLFSISQNLGVTPYMLLLSVYYILLYKYTAQDDIVVGTPIINRNSAELYNIIGMFVNSLPLKTNIDSNLSFIDFLKQIKSICLNAYKYQNYPFDKLVASLNLTRDTSRNPLFDTMFIYQNNGYSPVEFNDIKTKYYVPNSNISKFDLSLEVIPEKDILNLSFEYATKLFEKSFIENLANHYSNILHVVLDNLDIKLSSIDMLSEKERNTILYEFNNTKMDYPNEKTISQLFEEQVERTPDNIAVVFEDKKLTYKELNEKSNSLAHYLRNSGISRNDIVGIMMNRSLEMIISIIAVLKSGGAYLLIDNNLPSDRVEYMLNNCNTKLLILDYDYKVNFVNKINPSDMTLTNSIDNLDIVNSPNDNFAIIYTSGSTGNPKGVMLRQIGVSNLILFYDKIVKIKNYKNHLGLASVSFDMFIVELFTSILLGRCLFLLNEEEIKNPVIMSQKIINNNIEFLLTTPTKIELLLSNNQTALCLKTLKAFQLGGEVFTSSLYEKLSSYTDAKIYNGYGPTEITACCSNKLIKSKTNINIGSANPNTSIYILDKHLNPCPIGVPGEIYVGGLGVAKGYVNDLQKTNSAFLKTDFSNGIIYKTGDIAKFTSNGEIQYIGRNDFQVKLKGLRIELSEIEKQFLSIDYVTNCVVLADKTKTYLKAFFTATEELNIPTIRKQLLEKLPKYMVPNYIFQIDSIPITSNGKIDRKKLDEYKCEIIDNNTTYIEPETETQKLFCSIWEDILKTKVGIDNDLFELGADSLSAIKFKVEALNNNIDIPYADIFKYKTIRKLSEKKSKAIESIPLESYDYTKINKLLKNNKLRLNYKIAHSKNNNVLLFGSNGFVGMHIINSFIKNDSGNIYCVMRDKNNNSSLDRFINTLHFYFGNALDSYINKRIFIIKGNITKENFDMSKNNFENIVNNTSIVINAAANVKHYGNFDKFKNINIDSTINVINYCKKYNKRLLHLSTLSISGNMFLDGSIPLKDINKSEKIYFAENNLFINQSLDNVYTRSKFEAEKIILDNIADGLDAKILRLGNITSRFCDGVFQINPEDNAFVNRFKSIMELKVIPKSLLEQEVEFTPVDLCSEAIVKIMQYNSKIISVVHVYDSNHIKISKILKILNELNIKINTCSDEEFANLVTSSNSKSKITGIVNDLTPDKKLKYSSNIKVKSNLSIDYLAKCNFRWKKINKTYIEKYFKYLININFLEEV